MDEKTRDEMLETLDNMLNEEISYYKRLEYYEFLAEDCEQIVDIMLAKLQTLDGDTGNMLMEVLANYKDNRGIYMSLVGYLYKGEDIPLFAKLLGSYGDDNAIMVLKTFSEQCELNYVEFLEIRNAVETLGGDFELKQDFSEDPFYKYLKSLNEEDDSRKSPFEDFFNQKVKKSEEDNDEYEDDSDEYEN